MRYLSTDSTFLFGTRDKLLRAATCALLVGGGLAVMTDASAQSVVANSPIQASSPSLQAGPLTSRLCRVMQSCGKTVRRLSLPISHLNAAGNRPRSGQGFTK